MYNIYKKETVPFTYLIGWSEIDKWYYGVRYIKGCNPSDLWKTYFTSSKHVKKIRDEYGDPDVIQIRKIFSCRDKAIDWELKVLKKLKVKSNSKWLNVAIGKPTMLGKKHSEETKQKMRKPKPPGFGEKVRAYQKQHIRTQEHKDKLSKALSGRVLKPEWVAKRSATYKLRKSAGLHKPRVSKGPRGPYKKRGAEAPPNYGHYWLLFIIYDF